MTSSQAPTTLLHAQQWAKLDPNDATSSYVQSLIAKVEKKRGGSDDADADAAYNELKSLFPVAPNTTVNNYQLRLQPRIGFGTAGLRGHMQPGPLG